MIMDCLGAPWQSPLRSTEYLLKTRLGYTADKNLPLRLHDEMEMEKKNYHNDSFCNVSLQIK
nr:hypothetical protein [Tanacetum cinerariifolium]